MVHGKGRFGALFALLWIALLFAFARDALAVAGVSGELVVRYRLYSPTTSEHLYTTDLNEYQVLPACCGWGAEGAIYQIFKGPGSLNGVTVVPYYRLYNPYSHQHHWTTDAGEYAILHTLGWSQEGIDGYILPAAASGAIPLHRLYLNALGGLHLWTVDVNELNYLTANAGWVYEGVAGSVLPLEPAITSLGSVSAVPLTTVAIHTIGFDVNNAITIEYSNGSGFSLTTESLYIDAAGTITAAVPLLFDSITHDPGPGTVSVALIQGARKSNSVQLNIEALPDPAAYGLKLGDLSRDFLEFQSILLGRRIGQMQAARALLGVSSTAAETTLTNRLKATAKARNEVELMRANNALVIAGGTSPNGLPIKFDRNTQDMMDRIFLTYMIQLSDATKSTAKASVADPIWTVLKTAKDGAKLIKKHQDLSDSRDLTVFAKAAMEGIKTFMKATGPAGKALSATLGAGMSIFDIAHGTEDMCFDLWSIMVDSSTVGGSAYLAKDYANLEKHRISTLDAATSGLTQSWLKIVPTGTPGSLNIAGIGLTSNLIQIFQSGDQSETRRAANQIAGVVKNPFPPHQGFAEAYGTDAPGQNMFDLCCLGGKDIIGIADTTGNYSTIVPVNVSGTNYGNLSLKFVDAINAANLGSTTVDLRNLDTNAPLRIPTGPRICESCNQKCLDALVACNNGCVTLACVNACYSAYNSCPWQTNPLTCGCFL